MDYPANILNRQTQVTYNTIPVQGWAEVLARVRNDYPKAAAMVRDGIW